ncbi:related to 2-5A-dependent ribonuclease [Phialocephala subalpina]|uniref:Related to 2-5A-dependent ribonuclease n=1 Tax=Phialocephala subalpina TaxID=576137 RepID=A0A1L7XTX8_9HELO|nr:related to 2-5A-dependent ribonuclease [Phialocephala subalpina]
MSFGFSVGDFIAAIELANKIRKEFVDAPNANVAFLNRELNDDQKRDLEDIDKGCRNILDELQQILDKNSELSSESGTIGKRIKRVWKRLNWKPEDIDELRSRISTNIGFLNAFNGRLTRDNVVKLTWLETDKQTLFCPGIPEAGKTILISIVVEELTARFHDDESIGIAYLYCNFRRQDEQKIDDLLASLLKQLVESQLSLPGTVKDLYDRYKTKQTRPSLDEVSRAIQSVAALYSRVFIIVDALDECQTSDGCRSIFLTEIFKVQASSGANVLATSRFIPEITEKFDGSILLEIRASEEDVRRYLDGHMFRLPGFVNRSLELQDEIKTGIVLSVKGMFLHAQLHLDSLIGKRSPQAVRNALAKLPTGSDAYDHACKDAMERIKGQVTDQEVLAKQVLSWITCAKRPLITLELQHALAVEVGRPRLEEDNISDVEDMVSVCAGLVTVDKENNIIRLVHYTTQQYFERTQKDWFPDAKTEITKICVTYLSFSAFESRICETDADFEDRLQSHRLYNYAARNWGLHARQASALEPIINFLESRVKVEASSQAMMASKEHTLQPYYSQAVPKHMTGLHLAAFFRLDEVLKALLGGWHNPNLRDTYGQTPLGHAVGNGHGAVDRLLPATGNVYADWRDGDGRTPLSYAARNGHESVVRLLLDTGNVYADWRDRDGRTPLSYAAQNGHGAVLEVLLALGKVDPDAKDGGDWTPLMYAAHYGHEAVAKLLLASEKVDPDAKDLMEWTPLIWAAQFGHTAIVRRLLDTGKVYADLKDDYGRTPLSYAAQNGHEAIVHLLLASGQVNPFVPDFVGWTPLIYAAKNGHKTVVKSLEGNAG